ncbi:hypothetical protein [Cupriavidus numazuensis]|uniref:Phospholipase D-like domain-containing protein n=1 Tax=Cupriavidus numazuensis TaxID=221992 RepID=A0ABN7QEU3_9BURK|nr:hypothetical protein [Cupriavidus numazuensis]CAG2161344.1 hypothetical protein LMG26411_08172 [Cupriavidus numazuensis]
MIQHNKLEKSGIKIADITHDVHSIASNASKVLIICGYSFTKLTHIRSVLKQVVNSGALAKHCILPLDLHGSKDANRQTAIDLIKNGVSVSVESMNHSKWLMSESSLYFGSANFTMMSLERRIEVVTFRNFLPIDPLRSEFLDFTLASFKKVKKSSYRSKLHGVISRNDKLISSNSGLIKSLNTSIEKVSSTVKAIGQVRSSLFLVMENSYWLLNDKHRMILWKFLHQTLNALGRIEANGYRILEAEKINDRDVKTYNQYCEIFNRNYKLLKSLADDFLESSKTEDEVTIQNRRLALTYEKTLMQLQTS